MMLLSSMESKEGLGGSLLDKAPPQNKILNPRCLPAVITVVSDALSGKTGLSKRPPNPKTMTEAVSPSQAAAQNPFYILSRASGVGFIRRRQF